MKIPIKNTCIILFITKLLKFHYYDNENDNKNDLTFSFSYLPAPSLNLIRTAWGVSKLTRKALSKFLEEQYTVNLEKKRRIDMRMKWLQNIEMKKF